MNLFKIFDATRKQREQIKSWAAKAGMDGEAIVSKVESAFETDAEQFAAARWLIKGYDESSFKQALYICSQKKIDPMGVDPEELVQKNPEVKPKEKPINPDDVLTDRKDEGDGVVSYAARDKDREVLRQIINTHYGKDASPWCLLQGDNDGNLTEDSEGYWSQYHAYPKRVAFRNGKLLAFSAGSKKSVREWWDRMDRSFPFIPYDGKTWLGKNGGTYEIRKGDVYKTEGDTYSRLSSEYSTDIEKSKVEASVGSGNDIKVDGGWYEISSQDATHYYVDNGTVKFGVLKDTLQKDGLFECHSHDTLIEKSFYKDGKEDGPYVGYYYGGQLRVKYTNKNGKKDGPYEEYYENGQLLRKCTYKHGQYDGSYEEYYPNGQLHRKCVYKNGVESGSFEEYYGNGKLHRKCVYKNGRKDGLFEEYQVNGKLQLKCTYKDGQHDGPYEGYHDNGQLRVRCTYKNEKREGLFEGYYPNGQLASRCLYKNDHIQGLLLRYYGNGQLMSRGTYENGELVGPYERYDMHGNLVESGE